MVRRLSTPKQFSSTVGAPEGMMAGEESSTNFRRKMLKVIQEMNERGKHLEAQQLYQKYFGGSNGKS